jgi:two-component system, chemotaxis family, sensor kinase Cph1
MAAAKGEDGIENHQSGPRPEAGDLTTCNREPIHIPGSIQPHGVLLSLDDDSLSVLQASENVRELFGRETPAILGTALPKLLGPEKGEDILQGLRNPFLNKSPSTSVLSR